MPGPNAFWCASTARGARVFSPIVFCTIFEGRGACGMIPRGERPEAIWFGRLRTCLRYAQSTGDINWLRSYLPTLRHGLGYLTGMVRQPTVFDCRPSGCVCVKVWGRWLQVNSSVGLLRADGSLFIDIFDRHGLHSSSSPAPLHGQLSVRLQSLRVLRHGFCTFQSELYA